MCPTQASEKDSAIGHVVPSMTVVSVDQGELSGHSQRKARNLAAGIYPRL